MKIKTKFHSVIIWLPALLIVVIGVPVILWMAEESLYDEIESDDLTIQHMAFYKLRNDKSQRTDASFLKLLKILAMQNSGDTSERSNKYASNKLIGLRRAVENELSNRGIRKVIEPVLLFSNASGNASSRKKTLSTLISKYSDDNELMDAIASGDYVDMDVYLKLINFTPKERRSLLFKKIIDNNKLLDEKIPDKMLSIENIKALIPPHAYEKLLVITEIPVIKILGFGIIDFREDDHNYSKGVSGFPGWQPSGVWYISKQTTSIPNNFGVKFGMLYEVSKKLSDTPIKLHFETTYFPENVAEASIQDIEEGIENIGKKRIYYEKLDSTLKLKSGIWIFKIKHKERIVAKKTFHIEPH